MNICLGNSAIAQENKNCIQDGVEYAFDMIIRFHCLRVKSFGINMIVTICPFRYIASTISGLQFNRDLPSCDMV